MWVVTRRRFEPAITEALRRDPSLAEHLHVGYLDLPPALMRWKRRSWDLYWYYVLWQRALGRRARELHELVKFDVAHHVTFANDWLPCGLTALSDVPLVWGPVGGASEVPLWRLRRWLGRRGLATEVARALVTGALRRLFADPVARGAAVVVAQNDAVARRFSSARRVVVEPNAALDSAPPTVAHGRAGPKRALFVGRLVAWKGARLAIATIAHPQADGWCLTIYGEGYERQALERMARDLHVDSRVEFAGYRPRDEILRAYAEADAFLFPSLHDQAGWVVAEASSAGCPVVCLPLGGPPILAGDNAVLASLEGDIVENLARALFAAGQGRGVVHDRWSTTRLPGLLADWYGDALLSSRGGA